MCNWFISLILKLYRVFLLENSKECVFLPMTNICLNPASTQLTAKLRRISPKTQGRAEASPPSPTAPARREPAGAHTSGPLESDLCLGHQPALQLGGTVLCKLLFEGVGLRVKLYNTGDALSVASHLLWSKETHYDLMKHYRSETTGKGTERGQSCDLCQRVNQK